MDQQNPWGLFEAFGIEMEYMLVDRETLNVAPISDRILQLAAGELTGEVERGQAAWSNELVLHVLEIKVNEPVSSLQGVVSLFENEVRDANRMLEGFGVQLMPTAMHPWMRPEQEMKLWPHDYNPVYQAFDRLFNCRGHGWANLQSTHWNLPFANDREFAQLHAAIRLILPILPGLSASSPIYDGQIHTSLDSRLEVYRRNSQRIPSIAGQIVPEAVYSQAEYEQQIFQPMFRDIAPFDPEGTLQHIWLNARGAIARFDRGAIEIRVLDIQECPLADIAIGSLMIAALKALCAERWTPWKQQANVPTERLAEVFRAASKQGPYAIVPSDIACHFCGIDGEVTVGSLWQQILQDIDDDGELLHGPERDALEVILHQGTLSQRILTTLDGDISDAALHRVYGSLCDCLQQGRQLLCE